MKKTIFMFTFFFGIFSINSMSQNNYSKEYITKIPGPEYEAGWLHEFFFGAHWRDLWTTPLEVEILDLEKFAGGLTPIEKGGGFQTKSLKFKGEDGRIWKFRSLNKDPKKVLPEELQESVVADILQDQISTSNPLAPLVVAPFLDAVGVLQSKPFLVYIPDNEKLGEFRSEFANLLGMIEIHPDEGEEGKKGFEDADKVSGTLKLFETLEKKREQKVDKTEYLKAKLIDIFLGDWDRHTDQWRWARYDKGDVKVWQPIPRDRDQAFAKYDGLLPTIASYFTPQLTNFGYNYPQVEDITWNGRYLDRRLLPEIDKHSWDSVTTFVHSKLTDELINHAVNQLPQEFYKKASEELISKLKSRRDKLFKFSNDYYDFINEIVEIYCSGKDDYVEIKRLNDDETEVIIYKYDKDNNVKKDQPLYHKVFDNNLTKEFRINLLAGDDKAEINGNVDSGPMVRIIGGNGQDELVDNSTVNGYLFSITPFSNADNKTIMYDKGDETKIKFGSGTYWNNDKYPELPDSVKYEPPLRDRGSDWIAIPVFDFNSDDGLILGGGFILNSYNFRVVPKEYKIELTGALATNTLSYIFSFNGDFYTLIKEAVLNLDLYASELSLTKYYGFGNETQFDKNLDVSGFYHLERELINIHPTLKLKLFQDFSLGIGANYNYSEAFIRNDTLLNNFDNPEYGLGVFKLFGVNSFLEFDKRDNITNPYGGFYLNISGFYYPEILNNKFSFLKAGFDARAYFTSDILTDITFAFRAGGEKLFGTYPFFKAAFLGGQNNLRGYNRERFSGKASLFGQTELRFYVADPKIILKGRLGLLAFAETGRVFIDNDDSEKWHPSFGGGLWISYLNRALTFSFQIANSVETSVIYFSTEFLF